MKKVIFVSLLVFAVVVYVRLSFYTVDAAEYAYVTVLGKHQVTYDGADSEYGAGLKFGWPWPIQQVHRLDRRLQQFDLPELGQLTHDLEGNTVGKLLNIEAFVCWKIADRDPKQQEDDDPVNLFVRRIGTAERARFILNSEINGKLGAAIGQLNMNDLVNPSPGDADGKTIVDKTLAKLRDTLMHELHDRLLANYGIELVDIRLRRFNHPVNVRESNFQRIRAERAEVAAKHEADGEQQASEIISAAEEKARTELARAKNQANELKTKAIIEATEIRNLAHGQDKEFYEFLKKMEVLQGIVGSPNTTLLLSTHRPLFDSLFAPPRPKTDPPKQKKEDK